MHMYERCYVVTCDMFYTSRSTGRLRRKTCLDAIDEIRKLKKFEVNCDTFRKVNI